MRAGLAPGLAPPPPNFAARQLINSYRAASPPRKPRSPVQQHEAGLEAYVKGDLGESVARLNLAVWMSGPEQRAPRTLAAQVYSAVIICNAEANDRAHALLEKIKKRRPHDKLVKDVSRASWPSGSTSPELYETRAHDKSNRMLGQAGRAAADERAAASLRPPPRPPPPLARHRSITAPAAGAGDATLPPQNMGRRYRGAAERALGPALEAAEVAEPGAAAARGAVYYRYKTDERVRT